jgi:Holliday junction resolvasome RuvABC endonuclease subunit
MSIVVGIDPSLTSTGIAVLNQGIPRMLNSLGHKGSDADTWLMRSRRIVSQTRSVIAAMYIQPDGLGEPIDLVVMEGPSYGSQYGDQFDRAALWHGLFSALSAKRVPIAVVSPKTRAKWATGKDVEGNGNSKKPEVLAAVRDEWADVRAHIRNDDIADALTLAAMGALYLSEPLPIVAHKWRVKGLESVAWPSGVSV